jgi:hypothetical protein
MDTDYGRNLDRDGDRTKAFEPSLFVWATAMDRPTEDGAIVDARLKAQLTRNSWKVNLEFCRFNDQFSDEINFSSLTSVLDRMVIYRRLK